jgi:hypothetical protein
MGGGDPPQATTPAVEPAGNHQAERKVESEDESEGHASDFTGPEESPPAMSRIQPASPELRGTAARLLSGRPAAQAPIFYDFCLILLLQIFCVYFQYLFMHFCVRQYFWRNCFET